MNKPLEEHISIILEVKGPETPVHRNNTLMIIEYGYKIDSKH